MQKTEKQINKVVYNACFGGFGLSDMAIQYLIDHGLPEDMDIPRHHPVLVNCVEELGKKANGFCSRLKIAKIKGNVYRIDEYDGMESVETPDTYDWVIIE